MEDQSKEEVEFLGGPMDGEVHLISKSQIKEGYYKCFVSPREVNPTLPKQEKPKEVVYVLSKDEHQRCKLNQNGLKVLIERRLWYSMAGL